MKRVDWCLMALGSFMTTYGIFDFHTINQLGEVYAYGYRYSDHTKIIIALGVALLVMGTLVRKEKSK